MSNLQKIVILGIIAIVLVGSFFLFNNNKEKVDEKIADILEVEEPAQQEDNPQLEPSPEPTPTPTPMPTPEPTLHPSPPPATPPPAGGPTPAPTLEPTPTPTPPPVGGPTPSPVGGPTPQPSTIIYKDSVYSPSTLTISVGTEVIFKNQATASMWPATDVHPTHTSYPGSGIYKCGTSEADTIFDACGSIQNGDEWSFVFTQQGTWEYHDHDRPNRGGIIIVE